MEQIFISLREEALRAIIREECAKGLGAFIPDKTQPTSRDIVGVRALADHLGYAEGTVYNKAAAGEIPSMKQGKKLFFSISEVNQWLKNGKKQTPVERKNAASGALKMKGAAKV